MDEYYLAVDIGASSGRHMLGHIEDGKMVLEEVYRFENGMEEDGENRCWNIKTLFSHILAGMKRCRELGKIPRSMGIDTWGVDYVLLDDQDSILGKPYGYRDKRTEGMDGEVYKIISEKELYERTGIQKQMFNTIYQLMAVEKKEPENLKRAKTFLMLPDYFHFLLTGVKMSEYTDATSTQLVNAKERKWDGSILKRLNYPADIFLPLSMPGTVVGNLKEEIKKEAGFDLKVILPATHDTASAVMAVPAGEEDCLYISSGTWSLMGVENKSPICTEESRKANFTNEGGYDYRYRYLKNIMGLWMIQSVRREWGKEYSFAEICRMAEECTDFPSRVDVNDDRFLAPDNMQEAVKSYLRDTGQEEPKTKGQMAAVIYQSLARCYADTVCQIEKITGRTYPAIHIVGGGANAEYLNQLTARMSGKKVLAGPSEATAIGNLAAQMIAAKEFPGLKEARECVKRSFEVREYEAKQQKEEIKMTTKERYLSAKEIYKSFGVDTDKAMSVLKDIKISMQCWQGDDVTGFDHKGPLSGGIQTTGNYPGRARTPQELMVDIDKALSLVPGKHKINLHASYAVFGEGQYADRDQLKPEHFKKWVEFARERGLGIDFNPTLFSHDMVKDNLTLSSPDKEVRDFWIRHCRACIRISEYIAGSLNKPVLMNIWIPDGYKDIPADRMTPRKRFKESLDEILNMDYDRDKVLVCLESKVFGIGMESYTAGSSEFTLNYAASKGILPLMDNGHYHPTEVVSDKISSMLLFHEKIALHVTRPVRWDSDHVVLFDDETKEIAREIVRNDALDRVFIGLDFFDASINRIAAWTVGMRNMQKALLYALLTPNEKLAGLQEEGRLTEVLVLQEELKTCPLGDVWDYFCETNGVPKGNMWYHEVEKYERQVLTQRKS